MFRDHGFSWEEAAHYCIRARLMADARPLPLALTFPELALDVSQLVGAVREGLPAERFDALREVLDVPAGELADVLYLSPSTLGRRRQAGRFDALESERILRLAHLVARAVEVMEGVDDARTWLTSPVRALGGKIPLRYASVEPGAREVERVLVRLERGVYG